MDETSINLLRAAHGAALDKFATHRLRRAELEGLLADNTRREEAAALLAQGCMDAIGRLTGATRPEA